MEGLGKAGFARFAASVSHWVGHNFLGYDGPVLQRLCGLDIPWSAVTDTLVVSRLVDATLKGHSLEDWGHRLGVHKKHTDIADWSTFTPAMEERCVSDVEVTYRLWQKFSKFLSSEKWAAALEVEHFTAHLCQILHENGFAFNLKEALVLKERISKELEVIDKELRVSFLPKVSLVREVLPRETKFGTIAKNSIPKILGTDLSPFTPGAAFSLIDFVEFNPGSPKQIVERLNEAGWSPTEKTKGHKDTEKALHALKRRRGYPRPTQEEIIALEARLEEYAVSGWAISEENLSTLPDTAPPAAQKLARRLMLANRVSTMNQWLAAYREETGRVHGHFNHILPWTHRMSHDRPNMGNVPKYDARQPHKTPYSDEMRALWIAAQNRLLVGVDAESIQLRVLAHYMEDKEFIYSLVSGKKEEGNDPHSLNQRALGRVCKSRDDAKTFIYAWLLGAGIAKVAAILGCSKEEASEANENFLAAYPGLKRLKEEIIPLDAERGYFQGLDGRFVRIRGGDADARAYFALGGYLQNGESVIMKRAAKIWYPRLIAEKIPFWFVNFVHDEFQTETIEDMEVAEYAARTQAEAIAQVGIDLGLRCPMAGSVLNGHGQLAIGKTWMVTH